MTTRKATPMYTELHAILKRVSKKDVQYSEVVFPDGRRQHLLLDINKRVTDTLLEFFRTHAEFDNFEKFMINVGGGGSSRVDFFHLARGLASSAVEIGPARTVTKLGRFLENDAPPHETVLYLYGPEIPQQIRLSSGISIIPFQKCSQTLRKRYFNFAGIPDDTLAIIPQVHKRYHPTCVILGISILRPKWVAGDGASDLSFQCYQKIRNLIFQTEVLMCLISLKTSRQLILANLNSTWLPATSESYSSLQFHVDMRAPDYKTVWSVAQARSFKRLHEKFFALRTSEREKLRIPLERLNQAMGESNFVDAAIDLGIVLESLLTNDISDDSPITHLVRTRGAKFLGNTAEEQKQIDVKLKNVYRLRSKAVHRGNLEPKFKKRDTKEWIDEGVSLSAFIIRKMILQGIPSKEAWNNILYS